METKPTVTLTLGGDVLLQAFAEALERLHRLLAALAEQVGAGTVNWVVEDLAVGNATATVRGVGEDPEGVLRTTAALAVVSGALRDSEPIPFGGDVARAAQELTLSIDEQTPFILLATGASKTYVTERATDFPIPAFADRIEALGSLTGVVQTLSRTRGLTFVVQDEVSGRNVECRFREDLVEDLRKLWGKRARVQGLITRDARTGTPQFVSEVERVTPALEGSPGGFLRARGVLAGNQSDETSAETIRRMRDAG